MLKKVLSKLRVVAVVIGMLMLAGCFIEEEPGPYYGGGYYRPAYGYHLDYGRPYCRSWHHHDHHDWW